jgi:hypothetical protein
VSASQESRKKSVVIAFVLGIMAILAVLLVYMAVASGNLVLLAVIPALLLTSIPLANSLRRHLSLRHSPE